MRLFFISFLITLQFHAQLDSLKIKNKAIFIEAGGVGGYGGVHFEQQFTFKKVNFSYRFGLSTYKVLDFERKFNPEIIFPVTISTYFGQKHRLEIGIGYTYSNFPTSNLSSKSRQSAYALHGVLAYRLETQKNFIYKLAFTPMFEKEKHFRPWFGISIGKKFA